MDENDKSQEIIWHRIDLKTRKPDGGQGFVGWHEIQVPIDDVGLCVTLKTSKKVEWSASIYKKKFLPVFF